MPACLSHALSPFCPCIAVAFPVQFSSSDGWCESGKGQAGVLAAHADSLSDGSVRESRIRVALV